MVLVIEPIRYCVSVEVSAPAVPDQPSSAPSSTPATTDGSRRSDW